MRSLTQLAREASANALPKEDIDWLHLLRADWQVLADLAAADLVLWLPTDDDHFMAIAHCRPATSTTVHVEDIIGLQLPAAREGGLRRAMETGKVIKSTAAYWAGTYSMKETCVPVVREGKVIAVLTQESNLSSPRLAMGFEGWTNNAADILCDMISRGEYPYTTTPTVTGRGVPRVLDGVIMVDAKGVVQHTTPNAMSCLKRLGIHTSVQGKVLAKEIMKVVGNETTMDESVPVVLRGRASWRGEIAASSSTIAIRALPLVKERTALGGIILTRDVSEVRLHEQKLMTKDATIREIHHRVKNNLQTVSALLRLQARRSDQQGVKEALVEAERRVQAIATVHAALSRNVDEAIDFYEVACTISKMAGAVAQTDHAVEIVTTGTFGKLCADQAQALATVLNELVANSVEHGLAGRDGRIEVHATRDGDSMTVTVSDDGVGIAQGAPMSGLGTQIVHQMVKSELKGCIDWAPRPEGGTIVTLKMHVDEV